MKKTSTEQNIYFNNTGASSSRIEGEDMGFVKTPEDTPSKILMDPNTHLNKQLPTVKNVTEEEVAEIEIDEDVLATEMVDMEALEPRTLEEA
ncbi:hypothetical protein C0993_003583, partial [Termitomyces sp. T159_Od127]